MRALVLAAVAAVAALVPAGPARAADMDYWQYVTTFTTEEACHDYVEENRPWDVDEYACDPKNSRWDLYWIFPT
ncbi:hypothetical protein [Saccharothrix sp. Mg75]|uniref:hypothetical protein n=1 Tax=Saccharothrix sp. Mg75 TaxID=3445357 RepID=UPI003EE8E228